jgi:hypothetical protein
MKEAWRLGKQTLYDSIPPAVQLHVFLIFTDSVIPGYETVNHAVVKGIERLSKIITTDGNE